MSSNLMENIDLQIQENWTQWKLNTKKAAPKHIIVDCWKLSINIKSWKQPEGKKDI